MLIVMSQKSFVFPLGQILNINLHYNKFTYNTSKYWKKIGYSFLCNNTINNNINPNNEKCNANGIIIFD